MSWDIELQINTGREFVTVKDVGNYTYNCGKMFSDASGGKSVSDLDGMNCKEAETILNKVVAQMSKYPNKYREMNPRNGWGDYDSFLEYIEKWLKECRQNPKCRVKIL